MDDAGESICTAIGWIVARVIDDAGGEPTDPVEALALIRELLLEEGLYPVEPTW